jgi:hypothetical protein
MEGTIYDVCVNNGEYTNRAGKKCVDWKPVGVAFDPKNGGAGVNGKPFRGVAINGDFIIRPRKEKPAAGAAVDHGFEDDGSDFLES